MSLIPFSITIPSVGIIRRSSMGIISAVKLKHPNWDC